MSMQLQCNPLLAGARKAKCLALRHSFETLAINSPLLLCQKVYGILKFGDIFLLHSIYDLGTKLLFSVNRQLRKLGLGVFFCAKAQNRSLTPETSILRKIALDKHAPLASHSAHIPFCSLSSLKRECSPASSWKLRSKTNVTATKAAIAIDINSFALAIPGGMLLTVTEIA
jgi:hypothetical protein